MRRLNLATLAVCCLGSTIPALAQLDSGALRAKYGQPANRETFHMAAGFDMVVDYGTGYQVCKIEVPAIMPSNENVQNLTVMKQRMYAFLLEVVPPAMRGTEHQTMMMASGIISLLTTEYDLITVSELQLHGQPADKNTITLTFKRPDCQKRPAE
jgi:hypothetical protein